MGLCISKQIVEQFNGQITIKSRAGKGTRFTFWFELDDLETNQNQNLKKLEKHKGEVSLACSNEWLHKNLQEKKHEEKQTVLGLAREMETQELPIITYKLI